MEAPVPPGRSAGESVAGGSASAAALAPLPLPLVLHVFSLLPVACRLRCREVCRGWRAALTEHPSLWAALDLTRPGGGACDVRFLRAAAACARGSLHTLRLACGEDALLDGNSMLHELCAVAAANASTLRLLRLDTPKNVPCPECAELEHLLRAAPQLPALEAEVCCVGMDAARAVLRGEAPFAPLRAHTLTVVGGWGAVTDDEVFALAADVAAHRSPTSQLDLHRVPLSTPAALGAVVEALLARRLPRVGLSACSLGPASAPALARLLRCDALTTLNLFNGGEEEAPLLDAPSAALLGGALRANATLTSLSLDWVRLWEHADSAAALLGALTAHRSLRALSFAGNSASPFDGEAAEARREAAGAALGALLHANAPALRTLDVSFCDLREAGMLPLLEGLRHNTHLRALNCEENDPCEVFERCALLPAVRANTSLQRLCACGVNSSPAAKQAEMFVAARAREQEQEEEEEEAA
jgi:hypothetical protein